MTFQFKDISFLFLLVPVVLVAMSVFMAGRRQTLSALKFSNTELLVASGLRAKSWKIWLIPLLRMVVLVLLVFAIARPQLGQFHRVRKASGVDILMVLDVSGSMQALDFELSGERVDRLTMLKSVASEFVKKRESDRLGILVFGSEAFTQSPLTLDHDILLKYLDELEIGMAGDGTAIGQALGLAVKRLESIESKSKIVLLLTDGQNTAGSLDPKLAAQIAKQKKLKVYTIGIGQDGDVPVAVPGFFGQKRLVNRQFPVDMELLNYIAQETGGQSYRAQNTEELRKIYDTIDSLEKSEYNVTEYADFEERMAVFALPAIVILFLEALFSRLRFTRRIE